MNSDLKITLPAVVRIERTPGGQIVFLEQGDNNVFPFLFFFGVIHSRYELDVELDGCHSDVGCMVRDRVVE